MDRGSCVSRLPSGSRQRRAAVACTLCHRRKVRCDISSMGRHGPCTNCTRDGYSCTPHVSQRQKFKHSSSSTGDLNTTRESYLEAAMSLSHQGSDQSSEAPTDLTQDLSFTQQPPASSLTAEEDCLTNIEGYKNIINNQAQSDSRILFYVGEAQGIRSIFHASGDDTLASNSHFWVPKAEPTPLPPEDYNYLYAKGALSLPPSHLCWELIDKYFRYVYPMLPVVDPSSFLASYQRNGPGGVSILLLQSMFFTASNFLDPEFVQKAGAPSARALKKQFYWRAKALYDMNYEQEKITVIQSTLLLGFWFGISYDRMDGWHWTGMAISLAQTMGLHRNPSGAGVPESQHILWKRLWWCLFYRDRWTSLGMGRPLRINMSDCDVLPLISSDLGGLTQTSDLGEKSTEILNRCNLVAPVFVEVVNLTIALGDVMTCQFSVGAAQGRLEDIKKCEATLIEWYDKVDPNLKIDLSRLTDDDSATSTILYKYILSLYFQVAVITLQRPLLYRIMDDLSSAEGIAVREIAMKKSTLAAASAMEMLRRIIDLDMIRWLPPETVSILNSIIPVYFLEKIWSTGLKRQVAAQKIDLCFTIMRALSERYWAASFFLRYWKAAFERAESTAEPKSNPDDAQKTVSNNNTIPRQARDRTPVIQGFSMLGTSSEEAVSLLATAPLEGEPGSLGLVPENFWSGFLEDFQQSENFHPDFGSGLEPVDFRGPELFDSEGM